MKASTTIIRQLWFLTAIMGLRLSMDIDGFQCIPVALLQNLIPEMILMRPADLHSLLRVKQTREYSIGNIICRSCLNWPKKVWKVAVELAKDRPMLGSLLMSVNCLDWIDRKFYFPNSIAGKKYNPPPLKFASKLHPLPRTLDSEANIALFLQNFRLVDELGLLLWLQKHEYRLKYYKLDDKQLLNSGITHILWPPTQQKDYFEMLKKIEKPAELCGHIINLRRYLMERPKSSKNNNDKLMSSALKRLEKKLFSNQKNYGQSFGEFCCRIYLMSLKKVKGKKKEINYRLQNCDNVDFKQLVEILAVKLGIACQGLLSEENRIRASKMATTDEYIHKSCVKQEERRNIFIRWRQTLFVNPPRKLKFVLESCKFIWDNFVSLPLELNDIPLREFLEIHQNFLLETAKQQLNIFVTSGTKFINIKERLSNRLVGMNIGTFYYIVISLAKQFYFQSSEIFMEGLLEWIEAKAKMIIVFENHLGYRQLREFVAMLYPCLNYSGIYGSSSTKSFCMIS